MRRRNASTALIFALTSVGATAPAMAQTTAAELWAEWQAQASASGSTLIATETPTATGLTLFDLQSTMMQDDVGSSASIGEVNMTENPDGSVTITMSPEMLITTSFDLEDPSDPPAVIEFILGHEGLEIDVSGRAGERIYSYRADILTMQEGQLSGGNGTPPGLDLDMIARDIESTYRILGTDPENMVISSEGRTGAFSLVVEARDAQGSDLQIKLGMTAEDIIGSSGGAFSALANLGTPSAGGLPPGFEFAGRVRYGAFGMEFSAVESGTDIEMLYRNSGGEFEFSADAERLSYGLSAQGMRARVAGAEIPLPIEISSTSGSFDFAMPIAASDDLQEASVAVDIQGLIPGAGLWALADPVGAIPRDPITLMLTAGAELLVTADLMSLDPDTMVAPPGELRSLDISALRIEAAGLQLTGDADLSFAPGQLEPIPEGQANLMLVGGNALLDRLVQGGMLPAEQAAFVRGFSNVFARQGAAPDSLETVVEFGPGGSITANGVPVQ